MTNPDFIKLADSMGVHAIRCHNSDELPAKMKEFLEYDGSKPVLMECLVVKNEHVFPMVSFSLVFSLEMIRMIDVVCRCQPGALCTNKSFILR
jgi:thiamine pyrophosphate-dependent acetolactate synthase large subunit-like protein